MPGEADPQVVEPTAGAEAAPTGAAEKPAVATEDVAALRREAAQAKASQQRADQLAAKLAKYEAQEREAQLAAAGDEGRLKVELEQARAAAQAAEQRATLAEYKSAYPLAVARLGEDALKLSVEKLAVLQSDLAAGQEPENPTPIGSNPARSGAQAVAAKPETSEDILARLKTMGNPWFAG